MVYIFYAISIIVLYKDLILHVRSKNAHILVLFEVTGGKNVYIPASIEEIGYWIENRRVLAEDTLPYETHHGYVCTSQRVEFTVSML